MCNEYEGVGFIIGGSCKSFRAGSNCNLKFWYPYWEEDTIDIIVIQEGSKLRNVISILAMAMCKLGLKRVGRDGEDFINECPSTGKECHLYSLLGAELQVWFSIKH